MSALDDFELVKRAVMFDADTDERCGFKDDAEATRKAFNNLFTPRPLRELVAEGWKYAWVKTPSGGWIIWNCKPPDTLGAVDLMLARPILTPEDMGEG